MLLCGDQDDHGWEASFEEEDGADDKDGDCDANSEEGWGGLGGDETSSEDKCINEESVTDAEDLESDAENGVASSLRMRRMFMFATMRMRRRVILLRGVCRW